MKAKMKTLMAAMAVGSTLGFTASASANVVDLFDEPASPLSQQVTNNVNGSTVANQYGIGANILGGYRDLVLNTVSGGTSTRDAKLTVADGTLAWSNDTGVRSNAKIQWDGDDSGSVATLNTTGLGHANLVHQAGCPIDGCNTFVARINAADLGFNYSIGIYTDATHWSLLSSGTLFAVTAPYDSIYDFGWFSLAAGDYVLDGLPLTISHGGSGMADLTDVGAIEFSLSNVGTCYQSGTTCIASADLEIDSITKVPEPGSLALVGLGLAGLGALRRRKAA